MKVLPPIKYDTLISQRSDSYSSVSFTNKLEKHISDVKKGEEYLSRDTGAELRDKDISINQILKDFDINTKTLYNAYSTAFSYDKRARFINNTENAMYSLNKIRNLKA